MFYHRSPDAMKPDDRSHEENERQQRWTQSKGWNLAKNKNKLKKIDKVTFPRRMDTPVASTKESEEKESVIGSRANTYVVSKNSAEVEI